MKTLKERTREAFFMAVSQLETPIDDELEQAIQNINNKIESQFFIDYISEIVEKYPALKELYERAKSDVFQKSDLQELDKSNNADSTLRHWVISLTALPLL
jgi:hypothetical protein